MRDSSFDARLFFSYDYPASDLMHLKWKAASESHLQSTARQLKADLHIYVGSMQSAMLSTRHVANSLLAVSVNLSCLSRHQQAQKRGCISDILGWHRVDLTTWFVAMTLLFSHQCTQNMPIDVNQWLTVTQQTVCRYKLASPNLIGLQNFQGSIYSLLVL